MRCDYCVAMKTTCPNCGESFCPNCSQCQCPKCHYHLMCGEIILPAKKEAEHK